MYTAVTIVFIACVFMQVDLTGLASIKRGQLNKVMIQAVTSYSLVSNSAHGSCSGKTYPLLSTQVNHSIHLYVFGEYINMSSKQICNSFFNLQMLQFFTFKRTTRLLSAAYKVEWEDTMTSLSLSSESTSMKETPQRMLQ